MMTVHEVSKLTGVSIRALQYYDKIGLLKPTGYTQSGYRLYDDTALETLQQILLLTMKKEHLENLIGLAREIRYKGEQTMDFSAFDTSKIDEYTRRAKEQWGNTAEYKESEEKAKGRTKEEEKDMMVQFMQIFTEFGAIKDQAPNGAEAQSQVKKLQDYITEHFYKCSDEILSGLGQMYAADGEFKENIDRAGGEGTAVFVSDAICCFCGE